MPIGPQGRERFAFVDTLPLEDNFVAVMKTYTAVVERCTQTNLFVGYVPGFPGAHSQAPTLAELRQNLKEVLEMLLEDGVPKLETQFVGTQSIEVASA